MMSLHHWTGHRWLALAARWYLAYVFIYASLHKIAYPGMFALDIATYDILPLSLVNSMAIILPWMEFVVGILLVIAWQSRAAALLVVGMMLLFTAAILIALSQGLDMSCGCFASQAAQDEDPISWITVRRDVVWLALAIYVVIFDRRPLALHTLCQRKVPNNATL